MVITEERDLMKMANVINERLDDFDMDADPVPGELDDDDLDILGRMRNMDAEDKDFDRTPYFKKRDREKTDEIVDKLAKDKLRPAGRAARMDGLLRTANGLVRKFILKYGNDLRAEFTAFAKEQGFFNGMIMRKNMDSFDRAMVRYTRNKKTSPTAYVAGRSFEGKALMKLGKRMNINYNPVREFLQAVFFEKYLAIQMKKGNYVIIDRSNLNGLYLRKLLDRMLDKFRMTGKDL